MHFVSVLMGGKMKKINCKKFMATMLSCVVVGTSAFQAAYAVTGSEIAADKTYRGTANVASTEDFEGYDISVSFDVSNGKFANITTSSDNMARYNNSYKRIADAKLKSLEGKSATVDNVNAIDATSGATYTINSMKNAMLNQLNAADASNNNGNTNPPSGGNSSSSEDDDDSFVYGKANISFGDFYYGELTNHTSSLEDMDLSSSDKAGELKKAGFYDAVSSVTPNKYKSMFPTTFNVSNEGAGGKILGVKDVDIAIKKSLYKDAKKAISEGRTSNNPLLEIVKAFTENDANAPLPNEYKILSGDGTLTKTVEFFPNTTDARGTATISTSNRYGHYGIIVDSEQLPAIEDINGVIITTADGKQYAMKHLENIWRNPAEISFAAKAGFIEPHGNKLNYMAYMDIQGKTIKEIKYMVKNKSDLIIKTDLYCKVLLNDANKATISNAVFSDNISVTANIVAPTGTSYALASLSKGRTKLKSGEDYTVNGNTITIKKTQNTGVGAYVATFEDNQFADMTASFTLTSGHADGSVKIENNSLILPDDIDKADYYASITKVSIDGKALRGRDLAKTIFGDKGIADFDAKISMRGTTTPIFTKGENASYEIELISAGYPSVKGTLSNASSDNLPLPERTLSENGVSVTGKISTDAKLTVTQLSEKDIPAPLKDAAASKRGKAVVDGYEVSISGKYQGPLSISFTTKVAGGNATILHLRANGIEEFESVVTNGRTMITADSLSPFVILGKASSASTDSASKGENTSTAKGDNDKSPADSKQSAKPAGYTVKTGDSYNEFIYIFTLCGSVLCIIAYGFKKLQKK